MHERSDDWLAHRAAALPERLALRTSEGDLSYGELGSEVATRSSELRERGTKEGDVIALEARPSAALVVELHAAWSLAAAVEPRPSSAQPSESGRRSDTSTTAGGDLAVLARLHTSGTTGEPRAVDLTRGNFFASAVGSAFALGIDPADRWLCCLPLHHVAGLSILTRSTIYGTGVVLHDRFEIDAVAASLAEDEVSLVSLVPTQIVRLLDAGVDLSAPRAIIAGGGPVPAEVVEEASAKGATVIESYGMTETCSQIALDGVPLLGSEIRIEGGEAQVRGPVVAPASVGDDGWLATGDLGHFDTEGRLVITGRESDVIITGGENVMPQRVEDILREHPGVSDAAVIGRPDPEWQEAVTAVVVAGDAINLSADELRAWCRERLEGHEVPKRFEWASGLPRTASGKLKRADLR